ncbi:ankyrin repeat domain-containing protein [Alloprevotella tannerae]|uniref:ankyrin repeat domain-containing protein n=1 Tax=Alloprevotella tannerae TaxID=76122 RepID=UPI0028E413FD|nr:ankyrin repeat domain-containing protein [Alloprevotella tannerae]
MAKRYKVVPDPEVYFPDGQELKMATAIYEDKPRAIRSLIEEGIDLNHVSKGGMTYLYYAMLNKNYDVMELLLKHGADPNIHSKFYTNPAYPKKGYGDDKHIGACLAYCGRRAYDIKYMKLLVKYGANVNDTTSMNPIWATLRDKRQGREKIKYLVEQGLNLNYSQTGTPAICGQALIYEWDMVLFLMDLGADPLAGDDPDFQVAASVQEYFDEGFDINSKYGKMALEVKHRLEQRGVKFPYRPKTESDSIKSEKQPKSKRFL